MDSCCKTKRVAASIHLIARDVKPCYRNTSHVHHRHADDSFKRNIEQHNTYLLCDSESEWNCYDD